MSKSKRKNTSLETKERARGFCLTINNYEDRDFEKFRTLMDEIPKVQYGIFGREIAPTTGTPHIQGYVHFKNANKGNRDKLQSWFPRATIIFADGSPLSQYNYCSKDGDYEEIGERPKGSGARTDIYTTRDIIVSKKVANIKEFYEHEDVTPSYQNLQIYSKMSPYYAPKRWLDEMPTVIYLYGETGLGKTRYAYEYINKRDFYQCGPTGQWWDGYYGQKIVLIDEWRSNWCPQNLLLRILDKYPLSVPIKGGFVELLADTFIITSPGDPVSMWDGFNSKDKPHQFMRRITKLIEVVAMDEYVEKTEADRNQLLEKKIVEIF